MGHKLDASNLFVAAMLLLIATIISVALNLSLLRYFFGFVLLTFLPGLLIISALRLQNLNFFTKVALSVGISLVFVMTLGLAVNSLSAFGYVGPLSPLPVMLSFSLAIAMLAAVAYVRNRGVIFESPELRFTDVERSFLIASLTFPFLAISGMTFMNATENNVFVLLLLISIPVFIVLVAYYRQHLSDSVYPIFILSIGLALLLRFSLRSHYLLGSDVHLEYLFFQTTYQNQLWNPALVSDIFGVINGMLVVSVLPTVYQVFMNINPPEYVFKMMFPLIFSVIPLAVFLISKHYTSGFYAFLAASFFMSGSAFLSNPNARIFFGVLFFALIILTWLSTDVPYTSRKALFIVFSVGLIFSYYAASFLFFFIILTTWIVFQLYMFNVNRHTHKGLENEIAVRTSSHSDVAQKKARNVTRAGSRSDIERSSLTITSIVLFFALLYFWYSEVTRSAFAAGVMMIQRSFASLTGLFVLENRGGRRKQRSAAHSRKLYCLKESSLSLLGLHLF